MDWWNTPGPELVFLCGAGISRPLPSALPTVADFVTACVRHSAPSTAAAETLCRRIFEPPSPRFEVLIDAIQKYNPAASKVGDIFDSKHSNYMHAFCAAQCARGASIITTNFDNCIERYLPSDCERLVFDGVDLSAPPSLSRVLVKPHGSNPMDSMTSGPHLVMTIRALARTARGYASFPAWREYLLNLLRDKVLMVLGYSGSDDFDIVPLLKDSRPRELLWFQYVAGVVPSEERPLTDASMQIQDICRGLPARLFLGELTLDIPSIYKTSFRSSLSATSPTLSILDWLTDAYDSDASRDQLFATIAFHYRTPKLVANALATPTTPHQYALLGRAHYFLGQHELALQALEHCRGLEHLSVTLAESAFVASACHVYRGHPQDAIKMAQRYVECCTTLGDPQLLITAYNNLGGVLSHLRQPVSARAAFQRALATMHDNPSLEGEATAKWGLADLAAYEGKWRDAIEYYTQSKTLYVALGGFYSAAVMDRNLCHCHWHLDELGPAEEAFTRAWEILKEMDSSDHKAYLLYDRIAILAKQKRMNDAIDVIKALVHLLNHNAGFPIVANLVNCACICDIEIGSETSVQFVATELAIMPSMYESSTIPDEKHAYTVLVTPSDQRAVLRDALWDHLFGASAAG